MTSADWAILIPAIVAFLTAVAGILKAYSANRTATVAKATAKSAQFRNNYLTEALNAHLTDTHQYIPPQRESPENK